MASLNLDDTFPGTVGNQSYEYRFAENNPFLEDPDPLARGKELFRTVRCCNSSPSAMQMPLLAVAGPAASGANSPPLTSVSGAEGGAGKNRLPMSD